MLLLMSYFILKVGKTTCSEKTMIITESEYNNTIWTAFCFTIFCLTIDIRMVYNFLPTY